MTKTQLKALRTRAGLKQREMADMLNITIHHYQKLESGRHRIGGGVLAMIELMDELVFHSLLDFVLDDL